MSDSRVTDHADTIRMEWQICPKCIGQGHVGKPPYVAGDQTSWVACNTGGYKCPVCGGSGMVTRP